MISLDKNSALNQFQLVSGTPPRSDNDVVIDRKSARDGHLNVGDTTTVLVQGGPQHVRIAGIARFGNADSPGGATIVAFRAAVAQRLVADPGKYDAIVLVAAKGVSQTELVKRVSSALPAGIEVVTGKAVTEEAQSALGKALGFFYTFLLIFAVIAVLVGGFMMFNTFSITVAQRTRENGLLRALGAGRGQILGSVLVEAVAVGLIASVLGIGAGIGVAIGLKNLLIAIGIDVPAQGLVVSSSTVVISLVVGVGVTALSALSPARKAAKVPPIAAMQLGIVGSTGYGSKQRIYVGAAVLGLGLAALLVGLFGGVARPIPVVGAGALLVFFGVSILGRTVALPLSRMIGAPLPRLRGITGELARENAMRNPKRTAASASALMIGVGVVGFITIFVSSMKASINSAIDRGFTGDIVLNSGGGIAGGVDPGLAQRVATVPEVAAASGLRVGVAQVDGKAVLVQAGDPRNIFNIMTIDVRQGSTGNLDANSIGVYDKVAKDKNWTIGSAVPVTFASTGHRVLRVAAIYGENAQAGNYFLGTAAYSPARRGSWSLHSRSRSAASFICTTGGRASGVASTDPTRRTQDPQSVPPVRLVLTGRGVSTAASIDGDSAISDRSRSASDRRPRLTLEIIMIADSGTPDVERRRGIMCGCARPNLSCGLDLSPAAARQIGAAAVSHDQLRCSSGGKAALRR